MTKHLLEPLVADSVELAGEEKNASAD